MILLLISLLHDYQSVCHPGYSLSTEKDESCLEQGMDFWGGCSKTSYSKDYPTLYLECSVLTNFHIDCSNKIVCDENSWSESYHSFP